MSSIDKASDGNLALGNGQSVIIEGILKTFPFQRANLLQFPKAFWSLQSLMLFNPVLRYTCKVTGTLFFYLAWTFYMCVCN